MNILKSRGLSLVTALFASTALVIGIAPAATADAPLEGDRLHITNNYVGANPSEKLVTGLIFQFAQRGGMPQSDVQVHISTFSCGRFLQQSSGLRDGELLAVEFSPSGGLDSASNSVNRLVSKSVEYQIDIVQPGFDAYHLSGSITDYGTVDGKPLSSFRPSCDDLANGGGTPPGTNNKCVVKVEAKTVGQARVGKTVKAKKPRTSGTCGKSSYTWKANGKTVKKGKSLYLAKNLRGKTITVKVSLSQGPDKTLHFGRAK